jgi:hypothetical protein
MTRPPDKPSPLTAAAAHRYVQAWSHGGALPADEFHVLPNGDFRGRLRGVDFEYSGGSLTVRAMVSPFAAYIGREPAILAELQRVAAADPRSLTGARFELIRVPWQIPENEETSLYLRKDFSDGALPESGFTSEVDDLRRVAFEWGRMKLQKITEDALRKVYPK